VFETLNLKIEELEHPNRAAVNEGRNLLNILDSDEDVFFHRMNEAFRDDLLVTEEISEILESADPLLNEDLEQMLLDEDGEDDDFVLFESAEDEDEDYSDDNDAFDPDDLDEYSDDDEDDFLDDLEDGDAEVEDVLQ
jgi:hypothetical protein